MGPALVVENTDVSAAEPATARLDPPAVEPAATPLRASTLAAATARLHASARRLGRLHARRTTGEWVADSVQIGIALLLWWFLGFVTVDAYPAVPDWFWPVDRTLGLLACLALWWARFRPVTVAFVVLLPAASAMSAGFAALAAVYRLGSHARPRVAIGMTALYLAVGMPYHAVLPVPGTTWAWYALMLVLMHLVALCFGLLARSRRLALDRLRSDAARERQLFEARIVGARRDERERVAREMHDVLAHRVSLVSVHAGALEYRLDNPAAPAHRPAPPSTTEIREAVAVIRQNAHLAVEELRHVLAVLRTDEAGDDAIGQDHPQPRLTDIDRLVDEARGAGQHVTAHMDVVSSDLPGTLQRTAFRVVQEGLTNARKHAPRAHVRVEVVADDDGVRLTVTNPLPVGVGPGEIPGARAGLTGLDERVRLDGGTFDHGVHDGEFRLTARLGVRR